jgi:Holliday junction DNA helicase RuvA
MFSDQSVDFPQSGKNTLKSVPLNFAGSLPNNPYFRNSFKFTMYAYLEGKFTMKNPAQVYVDINGVGYEVNISLNTYSFIQSSFSGKLYTYLQIKEDGHTLFGFFDKGEKDMFIQLISVSGIGATTARMMLSHLKPDEVSTAIQQGNVKLLESIKGIGKKTAERLVLELRDKVNKIDSIVHVNPIAGNSIQQDALNALVALGTARAQAENAIKKVTATETNFSNLEELIKKALKAI